jgi:hypothetical protein
VADRILEEEVALSEAMRSIAELDATISLAGAATDFGFTRPQMTEERVIIIKGETDTYIHFASIASINRARLATVHLPSAAHQPAPGYDS